MSARDSGNQVARQIHQHRCIIKIGNTIHVHANDYYSNAVFVGHVRRMDCGRISNGIMYGELAPGFEVYDVFSIQFN